MMKLSIMLQAPFFSSVQLSVNKSLMRKPRSVSKINILILIINLDLIPINKNKKPIKKVKLTNNSSRIFLVTNLLQTRMFDIQNN